MPLAWRDHPDAALPGAAAAFSAELTLWPHRSLSRRGFAAFIGATFVLLCVPLATVLGTAALWVLLPFLMAALAMIWTALRTSSAQAALTETLTLTPARIALVRCEPRGTERRWEAKPHWVSVHLHPEGGPVENYVTLRGGGREVEIGAFLSSAERLELRDNLDRALSRLREP